MQTATMAKDKMFNLRLDAEDRARLDTIAQAFAAPAATAIRILLKREADAIRARRRVQGVDEDELYKRAWPLYKRFAERVGGVALFPSRTMCGFNDRGIFELRNGTDLLARFRYDPATDRLVMLKIKH